MVVTSSETTLTMCLLALFAGIKSCTATALSDDLALAVQIVHNYPVVASDITYRVVNNIEVKLDVYEPARRDKPTPTLIFIHGGGWMNGFNKETFQLYFVPFLQLNWVVVNVDYRPSSISLAPAAVEDCLCAMRWVVRNAEKFKIDLKQLVIMGNSAGGHLALTTGLIPLSSSGLSGPCTAEDANTDQDSSGSIRPAAIVNWFGVTDVADLIGGANQRPWAVMWLGNQMDRVAIAKSVSPINYVRPGLPPVITIHGDHDQGVPYDQAVRFHTALAKAGVSNKLLTIQGGGHGDFDLDSTREAYAHIFDFLKAAGVTVQPE